MKSKTHGWLEGVLDYLKQLRSEAGGRGEKMQHDDLELMIEVDRILRVRAARKGGRASKKPRGVMLALQDAPDKAKSAWEYLKQYESFFAFKEDGYVVYMDDETLFQVDPAGKQRKIPYDTFRGYFSKK